MSNSTGNTSGGGVGLAGILFVALLVLKLTNVINWSWWLVTAPLWGSAALWIVLVVLVIIVAVVKK